MWRHEGIPQAPSEQLGQVVMEISGYITRSTSEAGAERLFRCGGGGLGSRERGWGIGRNVMGGYGVGGITSKIARLLKIWLQNTNLTWGKHAT